MINKNKQNIDLQTPPTNCAAGPVGVNLFDWE